MKSSATVVSEKVGFVRFLQIAIPLVSVVIALASLLTTVASRKKELTCTYLGIEKLITVDAGGIDPALRVDYEGQRVNSLVKMNFVIRNTGSQAIRADDVKEAVEFNIPADANLLAAKVEKTVPPLSFQVVVSPDRRTVVCEFPLLNSGDEAYVSAYFFNANPQRPELRGRIVDVREIVNADASAVAQPNPFPYIRSNAGRKVAYFTVSIANWTLALFFVFATFYILREYLVWRKWLHRWGDEYEKAVIEKYPDRRTLYDMARRYGRLRQPALFNVLTKEELGGKGIPAHPNDTSLTSADYLRIAFLFAVVGSVFAFSSLFIMNSPRGY